VKNFYVCAAVGTLVGLYLSLRHLRFTPLHICPIKQSPSWVAEHFSANQEIRRILLNPKVHYRVYKYLPPLPIPRQINQVHASLHHNSWRSVLIISYRLCLGLPSGLLPSRFPNKTLTQLSSSHCAACPTQHILLDVIILVTFGEEYRSLSSSLCSFLHSSVTSHLLGRYCIGTACLYDVSVFYEKECVVLLAWIVLAGAEGR